jgi:hypothetical protein
MSNESNIFSKPLVWNSVFENVFRNIFIVAVPAGAIQQRDGAYILDRSGNYIEVRA